MALNVVQVPQTTIQPTPGTQPTDVQADIALAGAEAKGAQATEQVASNVQQFSTAVMRNEALKMAEENAAQVVKWDPVENKPILDTSSRGFGGLVYNQTYDQAALATFRTASLNDMNKRAEVALAKYPNDPDKVAAELQTYADSSIKALPPEFAKQMGPQYSGVINAARSSASAGKARADIAAVTQGIAGDSQSIVIDMARYDAMPTKVTPQQDTDTRNVFAGRLEEIERKKIAAGLSPAQAKAETETLKRQSKAHALGISESIFIAQSPQTQDAFGQSLQAMEEFVMKPENSREADQLRNIIMPYLQRGATMNATRENALGRQNAEKAAEFGMKIQGISSALTNREISPDRGWQEVQRIESEKGVAIIGLRATHALNIMNAGRGVLEQQLMQDQAGLTQWQQQQQAQVLQRYGAVAGNALSMQENGLTAQIRQEGAAQNADLAKDGYLIDLAGKDPQAAQILHSARRGVAIEAVNAGAFDKAIMRAKVENEIDHDTFPEVRKLLMEKNMIGGPAGFSPQEEQEMWAKGYANSLERRRRTIAATDAGTALANGNVLSPSQEQAMKNQISGNGGAGTAGGGSGAGGGGGSGTNVITRTNEDGSTTTIVPAIEKEKVKFALDELRRTGVLPNGFVEAGNALPIMVRAETQEALINLVRGAENTWRGRYGGNFINNPAGLETQVQSQSLKTFGADIHAKLAAYEKGGGDAKPEDIQAALVKYSRGRSQPGKLPDPTNPDPYNFVAAMQGRMFDAQQFPASGLWHKGGMILSHGFGLAGDDFAGQFAPVQMEMTRKIMDGKIPAGLTPENMQLGPRFVKGMNNWMTNVWLPANGQAVLDRGQNPFEVGAWIYTAHKKDDLSFREVRNPETSETNYVLEEGGFHEKFRQANPDSARFSNEQVNQSVESMVRFGSPYLYNGKIKPGSIDVTSQDTPTGRLIYKVTGLNYAGGVEDLGFVKPDDPVFKVQFNNLGDAVGKYMQKRSAESIMYAFYSAWLFKDQEAMRIGNELMANSSGANLPGPTWTKIARSMRSVVGHIEGVTDEAWDQFASPDVGRQIAKGGWGSSVFGMAIPGTASYIFGGNKQIPIEAGEGKPGMRLANPPVVEGPSDTGSQYFDLQQKTATEQVQQHLEAKRRALVGGQPPPQEPVMPVPAPGQTGPRRGK